jgi:hypothetical protein
MNIKKEFQTKDAKEIWSIIVHFVDVNISFNSVTNIKYCAKIVGDSIVYKGGEGARNTDGEEILKSDFVDTFNKIKSLHTINTNSIKDEIPNSLYRKRTPFIGLLFSAGILEE